MLVSLFSNDSPQGATPLDPDEMGGLLATYISTHGELSQIERENILKAKTWALSKRYANTELLTDIFLRALHKRMFKNVWKWAGIYRHSDKTIGISWDSIPMAIKNLLDDTHYWITHQSFPWDEIAVRFHHRLVLIHPFPNGNGRHARLMTDILLRSNSIAPFTWGKSGDLEKTGQVRFEYISALKEADHHSFERLMRFVRS